MNTMNKLDSKVQSFLIETCKANTACDLAHFLLDSEEVASEIGYSHRWYDDKTVVVRIKDKLLQYDWYHMTGDNSASDMSLDFDLASVKFCESYQVTVTKYRPLEG